MTDIDVSAIADMSRAYGMLRGCIDAIRLYAIDDDTATAKKVDSTVETADSLWNSALERTAAPAVKGSGVTFEPAISKSILFGDRDPVTGGPRLTCETGGTRCSD